MMLSIDFAEKELILRTIRNKISLNKNFVQEKILETKQERSLLSSSRGMEEQRIQIVLFLQKILPMVSQGY
jgi:hypothetical protein